MSEENGNGGVNYILLVVIVVVSVLLATGGSYFMLLKFGGLNDNNKKEKTETKETIKKLGPTTKLSQFLVNLSDGQQYIKVNITFEVNNEKVVEEVTNRKPQIRDTIISILRTKKYKEITSNKGTRELRTEIMNNVNRVLVKGKITNVFFTEFVVQ